MIISDDLARRLEHAEAVDAAGCVDAACAVDRDLGAAAKPAAGGFLTFCGPNSPLTHATGIGMHGPVTPEMIYDIEQFFWSRGAPVAIDVCPHADPSLRDILCQRGYRITDYNNVLVRSLPSGDSPPLPPGIEVRASQSEDADLYARTVVRGFFGRDEMTKDEYRLGHLLFAMPCSTGFLAFSDGTSVAAAGLSMRNRLANFFGDATLRKYRGLGAHSALIAARLRAASEAGCELALAGTQPGSTSQKNYQRLGFEVAYSKLTMVRELRR